MKSKVTTETIQADIDSLGKSGGTIYIPKGKHKVNATSLPKKIQLVPSRNQHHGHTQDEDTLRGVSQDRRILSSHGSDRVKE